MTAVFGGRLFLQLCFGTLGHSGDNRDGLSGRVDKHITLSKFPPNLSLIVFAMNAFLGSNLKDVETDNAVFLDDRGENLTSLLAN